MRDVTIYTTDTCPYCIKAKKYLSEKGIEYNEKNVHKDFQAKQELLAMGYRTVPVIVINKREIVGFDKQKIDRALGWFYLTNIPVGGILYIEKNLRRN